MKLTHDQKSEIGKLIQEMNQARRTPRSRRNALREAAKGLETVVNAADFDQAEATRFLNVYEAAYLPSGPGDLVESFNRRLLNILHP